MCLFWNDTGPALNSRAALVVVAAAAAVKPRHMNACCRAKTCRPSLPSSPRSRPRAPGSGCRATASGQCTPRGGTCGRGSATQGTATRRRRVVARLPVCATVHAPVATPSAPGRGWPAAVARLTVAELCCSRCRGPRLVSHACVVHTETATRTWQVVNSSFQVEPRAARCMLPHIAKNPRPPDIKRDKNCCCGQQTSSEQ